jgi:hypothetical protein
MVDGVIITGFEGVRAEGVVFCLFLPFALVYRLLSGHPMDLGSWIFWVWVPIGLRLGMG